MIVASIIAVVIFLQGFFSNEPVKAWEADKSRA